MEHETENMCGFEEAVMSLHCPIQQEGYFEIIQQMTLIKISIEVL